MRRDIHPPDSAYLPRVVSFEDDLIKLRKNCRDLSTEAMDIIRRLKLDVDMDGIAGKTGPSFETEGNEKREAGTDDMTATASAIVRLGVVIGIDLYRTIALILKKEWERSQTQDTEVPAPKNMVYLLPQNGACLCREFRPDMDAICTILERDLALPGDTTHWHERLPVLM